MKMEVDVLESRTAVSKKGNQYTIALVRMPSGDGRVGKIFSDKPLENGEGLEVNISLEPNTEMFLNPRITGIVE